MSSTTPYYFRRRTIGRAASPPTWACYEQIPYDDESFSESGSESSCSEDEEDYADAAARDLGSDSEENHHQEDKPAAIDGQGHDVDSMDMDIDEKKDAEAVKDVKGKQRAVDPEPEPERRRRHRKKERQQRVYTLRPILTIQRSQGFVWNQDLFVPPYIKDRYVASTSPPNSSGFISTSASSAHSGINDYEIEVVEIRVQEGELDHIIP